MSAAEAALDLMWILRFWVLGLNVHGKWSLDAVILRVAASLWLTCLQVSTSRRDEHLLRIIGTDPWHYGWTHLWSHPSVYWILPLPLRRSVCGTVIYVGESEFFGRRAVEHVLRMLAPRGVTQQPVYTVLQGDAASFVELRCCLCSVLLVPLFYASEALTERLLQEKCLTDAVGSLNPPRVYTLLRTLPNSSKKRTVSAGSRLYVNARKVRRLRHKSAVPSLSGPVASVVRDSWCEGLRRTAAALCGRVFPNSNECALAAWRLAPGPWCYVVRRISQSEDGWRRARGLKMLRIIASKRRDLIGPISIVRLSGFWPGCKDAEQILTRYFLKLVSQWRERGKWIPILRHARSKVVWTASPSLSKILKHDGGLADCLNSGCAPACRCGEILAACPAWPCVTFEGRQHIAASQGAVPWPENIMHLAEWPASITLPPTWHDLLASVTACFRKFRDRCRIDDVSMMVESIANECADQLWQPDLNANFPTSWEDVAKAKIFLNGLFVSPFDHNLSRLGVFCPFLVYQQACKALDFGCFQKDGANIVWQEASGIDFATVVLQMASIPNLGADLQPLRYSTVPRKDWAIAVPRLFPKWKAPGMKWRLILDKHCTPCCGLHTWVSRAVDVALDAFPVELFSDLPAVSDFMACVADFNSKVAEMMPDASWTVAAGDMADCFHHLPCQDAPSIWEELAQFWRDRGQSWISVPPKSCSLKGHFGKTLEVGWFGIDFDSIKIVLEHFCATNYVSLPAWLGLEQNGAPMGDALSGTVLRLFKWKREQVTAQAEAANTVSFPGSRVKLCHVLSCNVLVLDVSFRDDLRKFCAWRTVAPISNDAVLSWACHGLRRRFQVGSMKVEASDACKFIGLHTLWIHNGLRVYPCMPDPWAAALYQETDNLPLKPWVSWAPAKQKLATLRGMLARAWYLSSDQEAFELAIWECLVSLLKRAWYPWPVVKAESLKWASSWIPKGCTHCPSSNKIAVQRALVRLA